MIPPGAGGGDPVHPHAGERDEHPAARPQHAEDRERAHPPVALGQLRHGQLREHDHAVFTKKTIPIIVSVTSASFFA